MATDLVDNDVRRRDARKFWSYSRHGGKIQNKCECPAILCRLLEAVQANEDHRWFFSELLHG